MPDTTETPTQTPAIPETPTNNPPISTTDALFPEWTEPAPEATAPEATPQATPPVPVETVEAKAERLRNEKGQFVKVAETVPAASVPPVVAEPPSAPSEPKRKVKVAGVEYEVTESELIKGYQTDQYLTRKGQKLAELETRLKAAESSLSRSTPAPVQPTAPVAGTDDWMAEVVKPYVSPLEQKIADLERTLAEVSQSTHPARYQAALAAVDTDMRGKGLTDFLSYVPKIEEQIRGMEEEEARGYNTPQGYATLYKDLKLQALLTKPSAPSAPLPDQRPTPKIVHVESGGGRPSGVSAGGESYQADMAKARASDTNEAWGAFLAKYHP